MAELLGKMLRIDPTTPSGDLGYTIPADNPFVGTEGARGEIWAIGLRNPWRASFDSANDTLWIADVGQASWEEVNREPANTPGRNYGWDCREGKHNFEGGQDVYELERGVHHDHMVDVESGKVIEFTSPEIERLQTEIAAKHGYIIEEHSLVLYVRPKKKK